MRSSHDLADDSGPNTAAEEASSAPNLDEAEVRPNEEKEVDPATQALVCLLMLFFFVFFF